MSLQRRDFLRGLGRFSVGLAGMAALAQHGARAADANGYRALVCLFMNGGSDAHNWVVPIDAAGYAQYAAVRRDIAWPLDRLAPIAQRSQAGGRAFGMPVELDPLRRWYDAGRAAFVANVGPLTRPISKAEYQAGIGVPAKLFSHNDQASSWMSLFPEGAPTGWGGRMADILMAANPYPVFTAISASGNAVFLAGQRATHYHVAAGGPVTVRALGTASLFGSTQHKAVLSRSLIRGADSADPFVAEYAAVMRRSIDTAAGLTDAIAAAGVPALPSTAVTLGASAPVTLAGESLARQLRIVAQLIAAGARHGMRRQVFMVSIGGFDSHANQMRDQPTLMARVALSVDWFLQAIAGQGLLDNVLLFSASDFGRTLSSNGDGCDHGWGAHHFVAGGGVAGGDIHGRFPLTTLGTADDVGSGRLLPSIAVAEYAAALGGWMGLGASQLRDVLPTLGNFAGPPAFVSA